MAWLLAIRKIQHGVFPAFQHDSNLWWAPSTSKRKVCSDHAGCQAPCQGPGNKSPAERTPMSTGHQWNLQWSTPAQHAKPRWVHTNREHRDYGEGWSLAPRKNKRDFYSIFLMRLWELALAESGINPLELLLVGDQSLILCAVLP